MDFIHFSYTYDNFDADYDFDSFKVVSLFVCLFSTITGCIPISLTTGPISPIFFIPIDISMLITISMV